MNSYGPPADDFMREPSPAAHRHLEAWRALSDDEKRAFRLSVNPARAVASMAMEGDTHIFTTEDFARWREEALEKAEADEARRGQARSRRSDGLIAAWRERKRRTDPS